MCHAKCNSLDVFSELQYNILVINELDELPVLLMKA